jgi:hypothetical protein
MPAHLISGTAPLCKPTQPSAERRDLPVNPLN